MPRGIPNKKPEPKVKTEGMYTSPIKQRVALTTGDVFLFKAGVPQFVREEVRPVMLGFGIMPVDGISPVQEVKVGDKVEPIGQKRLDAINSAIDGIVERNEVKDFSAACIPKAEAISKYAGFDVDEKTRDKHWKEHRQRAAAA